MVAGDEELHLVAAHNKHVKGLACFRCLSAPAGFTLHACRCSISDALMLDHDETVVFSNISETFEIHTDKILYGLDDNLSINFLF